MCFLMMFSRCFFVISSLSAGALTCEYIIPSERTSCKQFWVKKQLKTYDFCLYRKESAEGEVTNTNQVIGRRKLILNKKRQSRSNKKLPICLFNLFLSFSCIWFQYNTFSDLCKDFWQAALYIILCKNGDIWYNAKWKAIRILRGLIWKLWNWVLTR